MRYYNKQIHLCILEQKHQSTLRHPVFRESGIKYASTEYITVIIARIPKINDPQRCSGKIFVEDNGDRHRYSGAMTGMSRFLPPHVRRETDGTITRISNASQKRVPEQTPIRLTRIALVLLFFQFQHTPTSLRHGDQRELGFLASGRLPSSSFVFHHGDVSFDVPVVRARVCVVACCYTLRQCYRFPYEFVLRPRIGYCCIQSSAASLLFIDVCLSESGTIFR